MKTIVGEDDAGEFKITLDDECKLTYGPNVPYAQKGENRNFSKVEGYALRIYDGKKNLMGCLTNVKWFREQSISMLRVVERVTSQTVYKDVDNGGYIREDKVDVSRMLVQPKIEMVDEPPTKGNKKGKK